MQQITHQNHSNTKMIKEFTPLWATSPWASFNGLGSLGLVCQMLITSCCSTQMDLQTVPLSSEYIKTPNLTVKTLQMDNGSSSNDLFYKWPPSLPELQWSKNTYRSPPMDLKPIPMCSEHNNQWKMTIQSQKMDMCSSEQCLKQWGLQASSSFINLQGLKTCIRSFQMPMKTSPMDSERPKTPSWAFSAPHLAKKSKSYGFCHFSPSSSVTGSPFCTCVKSEPRSRAFSCA